MNLLRKFPLNFYKNLFTKRVNIAFFGIVGYFLLAFIIASVFKITIPSFNLSLYLTFGFPFKIISTLPGYFLIISISLFLLILYLFTCFIILVGDYIKEKIFRRRKFLVRDLLIILIIIFLLELVLYGDVVSEKRSYDGLRTSDLHQIVNALELYWSEHQGYPTSLRLLVKENYLVLQTIQDPISGKAYNYSYGIDKKTGNVDYYHLGALLDLDEGLDDENFYLFKKDKDYDSSQDTSDVNWHPDSQDRGPCLNENGFSGADNNNCGQGNRAGVYDRGVFPK